MKFYQTTLTEMVRVGLEQYVHNHGVIDVDRDGDLEMLQELIEDEFGASLHFGLMTDIISRGLAISISVYDYTGDDYDE